ncbi:alpha/beta fold hydrolase [Nonomuraea sp. NPDC049421]|uniref:alpha/beta fold hydrolase n=1 Tax=Nonomuraea sp. NPDC049421 TaxID=3155275 RepID=UPI003417E347
MVSVARLAGRVVAGAGVLALSPVLGLAGLAGTAMVGARPVVFAVAGLAVFAWVFFLGLLLCVPRPRAVWARWVRAVALLAVEALVVWQAAAATLGPPPPSPAAPAKVAGQREWRLPTGSRLAYVRTAQKRVTRAEPVVFLHGGPGVGDLERDAAFYGRLASEGFEVYVYDQLGAGRSARLDDPRGYGLDRDVADLEAVRRLIGAERLNLVARDHGAQLAAAYLVRHPGRVARAALYSPDGLTPSGPATSALLSPGALPGPRTLAVATLLQVDPVAAHAFAGDPGLSAHLARVRAAAATPCPSPAEEDAAGGYVALAGRPAPASLRADLGAVNVPVLIVKGACDTEGWSAAAAYREALPDVRLAYLGEAAGRDRNTAHLRLLRAFLTDRPLTAYEGDAPPPGYKGPA